MKPIILGQQTIANILIVTIPLIAAGVWILIGKKSILEKTVGGVDQRQLVLPVATTIFAGQTCGNHPVQEVPDWLRISKSHY